MTPDEQSDLPSQPHSRWATRSSMIAGLQGISQERWTEFLFLYEPLLLYWMRKKGVPDSDVDDDEADDGDLDGEGSAGSGPRLPILRAHFCFQGLFAGTSTCSNAHCP